jgi:hypothetical protein
MPAAAQEPSVASLPLPALKLQLPVPAQMPPAREPSVPSLPTPAQVPSVPSPPLPAL